MSKLTTMRRHDMIKPKFYIATRNTRWDVYPQREPAVAVAHDYYGFWALTLTGEWFKTPVSYDLHHEVTEAEAIAFHNNTQMPVAEALSELNAVGANLTVMSDTVFVNDRSGAWVYALSVSCGAVQTDHVWAAVHKAVTC